MTITQAFKLGKWRWLQHAGGGWIVVLAQRLPGRVDPSMDAKLAQRNGRQGRGRDANAEQQWWGCK